MAGLDLTPWTGPWPVAGPMSVLGTTPGRLASRRQSRKLHATLWTWLQLGSEPTTPESRYKPTREHALPQGEALQQARAALWTQAFAPERAAAARAAWHAAGGADQPDPDRGQPTPEPAIPPAYQARSPRSSEAQFWAWARSWHAWAVGQLDQLHGAAQLRQLRGQGPQKIEQTTLMSFSAALRLGQMIGVSDPQSKTRLAHLLGYQAAEPGANLRRALQPPATTRANWVPELSPPMRTAVPGGGHQLSRSDLLPGLTRMGAWSDTPNTVVADSSSYYSTLTAPHAQLNFRAEQAFAQLQKRQWPDDHPVWGLLNHLYALSDLGPSLAPVISCARLYGRVAESQNGAKAQKLIETLARSTLTSEQERFIASQITTGLLEQQRETARSRVAAASPIPDPGRSSSPREMTRDREQGRYEELLKAARGVPGVHDQPQTIT